MTFERFELTCILRFGFTKSNSRKAHKNTKQKGNPLNTAHRKRKERMVFEEQKVQSLMDL